MIYILYTIHVLICLFLILVVLLQQGKGADLSVFGGGATQAAFGARGAATLLHKLTVGGFVAFIVTTIAIGFMSTRHEGGSVMQGVKTTQSAPASTPDDTAATPATAEQPASTDGSTTGAATQPAAGDTATPSEPTSNGAKDVPTSSDSGN